MDLEVSGLDNLNLLYNYLDEFLFSFSVEPNFIASKVEILEFDKVSCHPPRIDELHSSRWVITRWSGSQNMAKVP